MRIDLAQGPFLGAQAAGEVAEVIDRQRDIGIQRLADRLAVVHRLRIRQQLQVLLDPVGDPQQHVGPFGGGHGGPLRGRAVCGVQRAFDVGGARARRLGVDLAADRRDHVEVAPVGGRHELAVDEVVVARLEGELGARGVGVGVEHGGPLSPSGTRVAGWPRDPDAARFRWAISQALCQPDSTRGTTKSVASTAPAGRCAVQRHTRP